MKKSRKMELQVQTTLEGDIIDDWTFATADTSYLTHGLHEYPARMIPQIAQKLIRLYTKPGDIILDPFCGSGTTLVEAVLNSRSAVGVDINPLATLIAEVKSKPINFEDEGFNVEAFLLRIETLHEKLKRMNALPDPPLEILPNLLYWFKERIARELEFLYQQIVQVESPVVQKFLKVVFSDTVLKVSNIDRRSSRFIRVLPSHELSKFNPEVIKYFRTKLIDSVHRMKDFYSEIMNLQKKEGKIHRATVICANSLRLPMDSEEYDCIITSPPYGEEKNTVSYNRWSKLSVSWLRLNSKRVNTAEKFSLGAKRSKEPEQELANLQSPTAFSVLKELLQEDRNRVIDALPFFLDYFTALKEMHRVLRQGGYCCIVIGDRSIRKRIVDMERVTVELAMAAGFSHIRSYFRKIPMKLIPWATPTGKTISRESIIILRKT